MADLPPLKDRLQPSLLDRLTDEQPDNRQEAPGQRVLNERDWRERILRDLRWLLNTTALESVQDLDGFDDPETRRNHLKESVVNFGIHELSGHSLSGVKLAELEDRMRQSILRFEPRILPHTLKVKAQATEQFSHNALGFDIQGDLWMQPSPLRLYLRTELDLETGAVNVSEKAG